MDAFSSSLAAAALVDGQHFTLPGYGTLEGVYISAQIDHIERAVSPPQLDIVWTSPAVPGAQSFAELLVNTGATTAEAVSTQEAWLDALERGERLEIGDLGYLELDERANLLRWVPRPDGLIGAYWSGGAVAVAPLPPDRERIALELEPAHQTAATPVVVHKKPASRRYVPILRYAAMFAGVLLGLALLRSAFGEEDNQGHEAVAVTISNDRLNRSPLDATAADAEVLGDDYEEPAFDPALGPDAGDVPVMRAPSTRAVSPGGESPEMARVADFDPADLAGEGAARSPEDYATAAAAPSETEYVVILGSFGSAANAGKLTERLAADGLLPFVDQPGSLTRVGVAFTANSPADAQIQLERLRASYAPDAWIMD